MSINVQLTWIGMVAAGLNSEAFRQILVCHIFFLGYILTPLLRKTFDTSGLKGGEFVLWAWLVSAQRVERLKTHFNSVVA